MDNNTILKGGADDIESDILFELTIPTSGPKSPKGEFIDETGIDADVKYNGKIYKEKFVKLKIPDFRLFTNYANLSKHANDVYNDVFNPNITQVSYISPDLTTLKSDKKKILKLVKILIRCKRKIEEIFSRQKEINDFYNRLATKYIYPDEPRRSNQPDKIYVDRKIERNKIYEEVIKPQYGTVFFGASENTGLRRSAKHLQERVDGLLKSMLELEIRFYKNKLTTEHDETITEFIEDLNRELTEKYERINTEREAEKSSRKNEIQAEQNRKAAERQKELDELKRQEDEIMDPEFKINAFEEFSDIYSRFSRYGLNLQQYKFSDSDFKYDHNIKRSITNQIKQIEKTIKENEDYMFVLRNKTGVPPSEKRSQIERTEKQIDLENKRLIVMSAIKVFLDEQAEETRRLDEENKRLQQQERTRQIKITKKLAEVETLKANKKTHTLGGILYRRKRDETFDEFLSRINRGRGRSQMVSERELLGIPSRTSSRGSSTSLETARGSNSSSRTSNSPRSLGRVKKKSKTKSGKKNKRSRK